jgi:hypothetical protein
MIVTRVTLSLQNGSINTDATLRQGRLFIAISSNAKSRTKGTTLYKFQLNPSSFSLTRCDSLGSGYFVSPTTSFKSTLFQSNSLTFLLSS